MRTAGEPPRDVPPDRLFRGLLARHPSAPLPSPVAGLSLTVRAPSPLAEMVAVDEAAAEPLEELRASRLQRGVLALVLWHEGAPAFRDADEVGLLDGNTLARVVGEVGAVLATIAPTYAHSDVEAWARVLERGAMAPGNVQATVALAGCVDLGPGGGVVPRPDRFWGCPVGELLDGHWMAWRAARAVVEKHKR